jgi:hypothetical protein
MEAHPIDQDLLKKPWTSFRMRLPDRRTPNSDIYLNSRYQVHLERHASEKEGMPDLIHLSFRRLDYRTLVPFEDKLRIKDELVNSECEGVELYVSRSREVDMANQYHLWVIESTSFRFPVGTNFRLRTTNPFETVSDPDLLKRPWTPLLPGEEWEGGVLYRNSRYQVYLRRFPLQEHQPDIVYLFLQRLDRSALIPYRDRMRVKDELIHPECEGIELLPARSRVILPMEGCALWVIDDPTFRMAFGFGKRAVSDIALDGAVQEPWPEGERPADCLSEVELRKLMRSAGGK